jgi:hypothetical protein
MGHCNLCDEPVEDRDIIDHIRLIHPVEYDGGPAMWPDGGLVILDSTLAPDDFTEGEH